MPESLSNRGAIAHKTLVRSDLEQFSEAMENRYHEKDNPDGAFALNIAENVLCWKRLKSEMEVILAWSEIPDWVAGYTFCVGHPEVRATIASFLSSFLTKHPVNPEHLALSAGAGAVIEVTSFLLADAGDVAVFPAPCYPVYKNDIGNKSEVIRYDLITESNSAGISSAPSLDIHHLEKAKLNIEENGNRFRLLILTTPNNPTGEMYTEAQLNKYADWCIKNEIHLIVNEIYGLSLINTDHPKIKDEYIQNLNYVSFGKLIHQRNSQFLHLWYAFSKDFGASGFRVGLLYSLNTTLIKAYDNYNVPHMISNHTQWLFHSLLKDHAFVRSYITENQKALTDSYLIVISALTENNIPYIPSRGSLFVWVDLSTFLSENSQAGEDELWLNLFHKAGVLLTPGHGFGHDSFGQFRIVYTCVSPEELKIALDRMCLFLNSIKT